MADPRRIPDGCEIPTRSYCDQPFVVQTDDGAWLCRITTDPGKEGASGRHVETMRSGDQGGTWSLPATPPGARPSSSGARRP